MLAVILFQIFLHRLECWDELHKGPRPSPHSPLSLITLIVFVDIKQCKKKKKKHA